ncbi:MAG: winged helix-turn-helix domain-containing protein [bacterium]|nr:winged helix-turn-helix domain-containing protein [bacterium]
MSLYEFGPFQLDVERLLLLHEGAPVALGPKVVETLLALVEHPGEVLAKGALLDRIWPEGFVEEANLAQNIYVLRKTLRTTWGVDAIETVPRRGYRFVADVRRVERAPLAEAPLVLEVPVANPAPAIARARPRYRWAFAAASVAIVALGFILTAAAHRAPAASRLSANGARIYQIGRYYWNLRTRVGVEKSLAYFAQVIDTDPHDARGYAALAEANAIMGDYRYGSQAPTVYFSRARGYAEKALAIDPDSAEAHASLGLIALDTRDEDRAVDELERSLQLDPSYGPAHEWYGVALLYKGRANEAFHQLQTAANLDPLSVSTTAWLGSAAYLDHRFNEAIAYSRQTLDLEPQRTDVLATIGEAYEAEGNFSRAIDAFKKYGGSSGENRAEAAALLAHVYAVQHRTAEARAQLAYASAHARDVDPTDLAAAAAAVGDRNVALGILRRLKGRLAWLALENDPRFAQLREDAAFRQLAVQQPA